MTIAPPCIHCIAKHIACRMLYFGTQQQTDKRILGVKGNTKSEIFKNIKLEILRLIWIRIMGLNIWEMKFIPNFCLYLAIRVCYVQLDVIDSFGRKFWPPDRQTCFLLSVFPQAETGRALRLSRHLISTKGQERGSCSKSSFATNLLGTKPVLLGNTPFNSQIISPRKGWLNEKEFDKWVNSHS